MVCLWKEVKSDCMRRLTIIPALAILAVMVASGCVTQGDQTACTSSDRDVESCTAEYDPVCGFSSAVTFKTYSNACMACIDPGVQHYIEGKCLVN